MIAEGRINKYVQAYVEVDMYTKQSFLFWFVFV